MANSQSTVTLQQIADIIQSFVEVVPNMNSGGFQHQPFLTCCNDVMNAICAVPFPYKWNEIMLPPFYTNSLQQDYAVLNPDGSSITRLSWLERGVAIDINNTAKPKPFRAIEVGRQLPQQTGTWYNFGTQTPLFLVNWFPNAALYYGTWGVDDTGSSTFGNNPGPGSIFVNPQGTVVNSASWSATSGGQIVFSLSYLPNTATVGSSLVVTGVLPAAYNNSWVVASVNGTQVTVTAPNNPGLFQSGGIVGNPASMPPNPITQIKDANGNLLVLTVYGTEGAAAPVAPPGAAPGFQVSGTGATTVWTVADPAGYGFRILPAPNTSGVVWQIRLVGQMKPVRFTSFDQTLDPLPDEYETHFRDGVIAQLHKYAPLKETRAKFSELWTLWQQSLVSLRQRQDRELEENIFTLERGIMGGQRGNNRRSAGNWLGPAYPFAY